MNHICPGQSTGTIELLLNDEDLQDYALPYVAEFENIDDGNFQTFTIHSYSHTLNNLSSGTYEISIFLNDECLITTDVSVDISPEMHMPVDPNFIVPTECGTTNGAIGWPSYVDPQGGIPPYTFYWTDEYGSTVNTTTPGFGINDLSQGVYSFHLIDSRGCQKIFEYELYSDFYPTIEEPVYIIHSCEGLPKGEIGFFVWPYDDDE